MIGALFIGGRSLRMGMPKSMIARGPTTLAGHLCGLLADLLGAAPLLVGAGPVDEELDHLQRVADLVPGEGPLSGLLGLMQHHPARNFMVLATDLYAMELDGLQWLSDQASASPLPFIWPKFAHRSFGEPLAAVYRREGFSVLKDAWAYGIRGPVRAVPEHLKFQPTIPKHLERAFTNANCPEDLEALQKG